MVFSRPHVFALNAAPRVRGLGGQRSLGVGACAAACAAAAAVAASPHVRLQVPLGLLRRGPGSPNKKLRLNWLAVDAISGAIGEIAQLAVLYPLDTIKVRCQAQGASAGVVLAELRAMGVNMRTLRTLYAGMGSAALCSAVIGAFYLLAFYTVKRVGSEAAARHQRRSAAAAAAAAPGALAGATATGSHLVGAGAGQAHPPLNAEGTHPLVASLAGVSASVIASVFEAPMETFKLRAQAGAFAAGGGSMLSNMLGTAARQGLAAIYFSYGAFMIKSIPYDFAELVTYSGMCDMRTAAEARQQARQQQQALGAAYSPSSSSGSSSSATWQERLGDVIAGAPDGAGDMLIGALAGAAAVLCSMPLDVIKTHMDLQPHRYCRPCPPGGNPLLHSTSEFLATGRALLAQGGPQALFVGVTPRLLQTLPSTMVYWFAVEGTRRALMQYVEVGEPAAPAMQPALVMAQQPLAQQPCLEAGLELQPAAA